MDKWNFVWNLIVILELLIIILLIFGFIKPVPVYYGVIDSGHDRCDYIDELDIRYYNQTEQIVYTQSCFKYSKHTYEFYQNNISKYIFSNRSAIIGLAFDVSNETFPIEFRVVDININRTIGLELLY